MRNMGRHVSDTPHHIGIVEWKGKYQVVAEYLDGRRILAANFPSYAEAERFLPDLKRNFLRTMNAIREAVEAAIQALDRPRDRLGRLFGEGHKTEALRLLAVRYGCAPAQDTAEQVVNVLRAVLRDQDQGES